MLNYSYSSKPFEEIVGELISNSLKFKYDDDVKFQILSISALTQSHFEKVDKEFKQFGKIFLQIYRFFKKDFTVNESELILDSFSKLVLKNVEFSNVELFPSLDIQRIETKLQIQLLLDGMYFKLLPNLLRKFSDVQFHF
jgi:hypothetical protein